MSTEHTFEELAAAAASSAATSPTTGRGTCDSRPELSRDHTDLLPQEDWLSWARRLVA